MAIITQTAASLRFMARDFDPDEITKALGVPTRSARKGETVPLPNGATRVTHKAIWSVGNGSFEENGDINQQIAKLFVGLSDDMAAWKELAKRFEGEIFVGLQLHELNEGLNLSAETIEEIGRRGLRLELDIYSGKEENCEPMTIFTFVQE